MLTCHIKMSLQAAHNVQEPGAISWRHHIEHWTETHVSPGQIQLDWCIQSVHVINEVPVHEVLLIESAIDALLLGLLLVPRLGHHHLHLLHRLLARLHKCLEPCKATL